MGSSCSLDYFYLILVLNFFKWYCVLRMISRAGCFGIQFGKILGDPGAAMLEGDRIEPIKIEGFHLRQGAVHLVQLVLNLVGRRFLGKAFW